MSVGVRTDGQVVLMVEGTIVTMNLAGTEWLRDRLFHICARERAAQTRAATEPAKGSDDDGCGVADLADHVAAVKGGAP